MDLPLERNLEFWKVGLYTRYPCDLRPCLYAGLSELHIKNFKKIPLAKLNAEPSRLALISRLCVSIRKLTDLPGKQFEWASFVKRWVKWIDANDGEVSVSAAAYELKRYCQESGSHKYEKSALLNLVARVLELPRSEVEDVLSFLEKKEEHSEWQIYLEDTNRTLDFSRLVLPHRAAVPVHKWHRIMETALTDLKMTDRALLIKKLLEDFRNTYVSRISRSKTLSSKFDALRVFVVWCDRSNHGHNLAEEHLRELLKAYAAYLRGQVRAGRYRAHSAHLLIRNLVTSLSSALNVSSETLSLEARIPLSSARHDPFAKDNSEAVREYCRFLHALIEEISTETILNPINRELSVTVSLKTFQIPAPNSRLDIKSVPLKIINRGIAYLRISCEMTRFIALTGCVLQMAEDVTIGDWSKLKGGKLSLFKTRANKFVELDITKKYESCINNHIEFLRAVLPLDVSDSTPLFPRLVVPGHPDAVNAHAGADRLKMKLRKSNSQDLLALNRFYTAKGSHSLTTKQLRKAKSSWLLRRYSGDVFSVSRVLGNSPQVAYRHYRGQGMFVVAESEWARFWRIETKISASLAPGACDGPGEHIALVDGMDSQKCDDALSCLLCFKYCGEDSFDYIHQMLTLTEVLKARGKFSDIDKIILMRINGIVENFRERHPDLSKAVAELNHSVEFQKNWHERYSSMLRILYAS